MESERCRKPAMTLPETERMPDYSGVHPAPKKLIISAIRFYFLSRIDNLGHCPTTATMSRPEDILYVDSAPENSVYLLV